MHELPDALTVLEQLPGWFEDYNENHPHKGMKMMSPREYKKLIGSVHLWPFFLEATQKIRFVQEM